MANVTISTSTSRTFLSWVAIFHLRQPMVCLSHSSYGMPWLGPLMNVLFWEQRDFHVSFSNRDMSGSIWNRPSGSCIVYMRISSNIMKPLSQMLHDILGLDHIQWHPPLISHFTKSWPCYRTGPYYRFWRRCLFSLLRLIESITTLWKGQGDPIRVSMICNPRRGLPCPFHNVVIDYFSPTPFIFNKQPHFNVVLAVQSTVPWHRSLR